MYIPCACACSRRKLDNIELSFFNNSRAVELVHSFLQKGALHDMSFLQVCLGHCTLHGMSWLECVACCVVKLP